MDEGVLGNKQNSAKKRTFQKVTDFHMKIDGEKSNLTVHKKFWWWKSIYFAAFLAFIAEIKSIITVFTFFHSGIF